MTAEELITKALNDAYKFIKEQNQTKETRELLINLFKAEILLKNCPTPVKDLRAFKQFCQDNYGIAISHRIVDEFERYHSISANAKTT
jgi:hypothetical protein